MSSSVEIYTFEAMDNAIVVSASSEADGHHAEHCIAPLEPDFAWEANEADAQHSITIDLTYPLAVDAIIWMHRETESSPSIGVSFKSIQYSHDATTWYTATTGVINPVTEKLIKVVDLDPMNVVARYWKFTFQGQAAPNYYCPIDTRISMLWMASKHSMDAGAVMPFNDAIAIPTGTKNMPFGKQFTIGFNKNHSVVFQRRFQVLQSDYATMMNILSACNGKYRPFIYREASGEYRLCKFTTDTIPEEVMDIGAWRLTLSMKELPIVGRDEVY